MSPQTLSYCRRTPPPLPLERGVFSSRSCFESEPKNKGNARDIKGRTARVTIRCHPLGSRWIGRKEGESEGKISIDGDRGIRSWPLDAKAHRYREGAARSKGKDASIRCTLHCLLCAIRITNVEPSVRDLQRLPCWSPKRLR